MTDILERLAKPAMWLSHEALLAERADAAAEITMLRARLQAQETPLPANTGAAWEPTHRHMKRGSSYRVLHEDVTLQSSAGAITEGARLVIYEGVDGQAWAREETEFHDGRFETLATSIDMSAASE
ncbi:hypothetical protein GCM10007301_15770 [Azorhizobium oxalatiphilum]|uniref:Uncharacterized protein n=1 Tax=Azorhizobium oxalatiphilum TaxID=980631 RepID=A0A917BTJ6_9HYPH|nr:hypothetical protein [Azorhizobium oxalatiphilum]GGF56912.1 hypothetical protein GCM10007301_15770 [Azorhizobium oxalatiphilum]